MNLVPEGVKQLTTPCPWISRSRSTLWVTSIIRLSQVSQLAENIGITTIIRFITVIKAPLSVSQVAYVKSIPRPFRLRSNPGQVPVIRARAGSAIHPPRQRPLGSDADRLTKFLISCATKRPVEFIACFLSVDCGSLYFVKSCLIVY